MGYHGPLIHRPILVVTGLGGPTSGPLANRVPSSLVVSVQITFEEGNLEGSLLSQIPHQHGASPFVCPVEADTDSIATVLQGVTLIGPSEFKLFLRPVTGESKSVATVAPHFVVPHRTVQITIADPLGVQPGLTGTRGLVTGVQTIHNVVTPTIVGDALTSCETGDLVRLAVVVDGEIRTLHDVPRVSRVNNLGGRWHVPKERRLIDLAYSVGGDNWLAIVVIPALSGHVVHGEGHGVDWGEGAEGDGVAGVRVAEKWEVHSEEGKFELKTKLGFQKQK